MNPFLVIIKLRAEARVTIQEIRNLFENQFTEEMENLMNFLPEFYHLGIESPGSQ